jgi:hypothetical protein
LERRKDGSNREVKEWKMRRSADSQEVRDPESGKAEKRFLSVRMGKGKDESAYCCAATLWWCQILAVTVWGYFLAPKTEQRG